MRRVVVGAGAAVLVVAAGGLGWLLQAYDGRYDGAFRACSQAEDVPLDRLREAPRATEEEHPGYPGSNLTVLLLPDGPAGSAHCYFQMRGDDFTLLGSSRD